MLGTQTSAAETDYLMLARVLLPTEDCEIDARHFDEERGELGQYGGSHAKIEVVQKIVHPGDVHRARHCPQNYNLLATKSPNNEVFVYDYFKHESTPRDNTPNPQLVLLGHEAEGYGINWSPVREGYLASAGDDNRICIWDINSSPSTATSTYSGTVLDPLYKLDYHKNVVEDVEFHPIHQNVFGSVSDDQHLFLWDLRDIVKGPRITRQVSNADVMSLSFNPYNEYLLATASSDNLVRVWDTRALNTPVHTLVGHEASVNSVAWAPYSESVLVSAGEDRRTMIWDCSRIGAEQSEADADDGPPELIVSALLPCTFYYHCLNYEFHNSPPQSLHCFINFVLFLPFLPDCSLFMADIWIRFLTWLGVRTNRILGSWLLFQKTMYCMCGSHRRTLFLKKVQTTTHPRAILMQRRQLRKNLRPSLQDKAKVEMNPQMRMLKKIVS